MLDLLQRPYPANPQYSYNNWSPPAQSNDTTNGYFLERSNSARKTLEKAIELCPEVVCVPFFILFLFIFLIYNFWLL
jgi:ubiquitin carboxyl-terminal hydrolase 9/24